MKILVTTTPEVYVFDLSTGEHYPFLKNTPKPNNFFRDIYLKNNIQNVEYFPSSRHHYGLCSYKEDIYVSSDEFPSKILKFDKNGNFLKSYLPPIHRTPPNRIHQIVSFQDKILAVSTMSDAIFSLCVNKNEWEMWSMNNRGFNLIPHWDCVHPNSINIINNKVFIVAMKSGNNGKVSSLHTYDECIFEFPIGIHVHNVFPLKDKIFVINSLENKLISLDGDEIKINTLENYYLKGIGVTKDFIVLGGIAINDRKNRYTYKSSGLIILTDINGNIIDQYKLKYGVNDLRILNEPDFGNGGQIMEIL